MRKGFAFVAVSAAFFMAACSETSVTAPVNNCPALTGTPWVPNITGVGDSNHDSSVAVTKTVHNATGPVIGYAQAIDASKLVTVSFDVTEDLLGAGSLSLVAELTSYPSMLAGGAWPALVSLSDGVKDFVGLDPVTSCTSGLYTASGDAVAGCEPDHAGTAGSAFIGATADDRRYNWEQRQHLANIGDYVSVNSFPTCNWTDGTLACPFVANNFLNASGRLRTGTYTAKYLIVASHYDRLNNPYTAGVRVSVMRKKDATQGGALDLNVILVGAKNITDSRTEKGQTNLNAMFASVLRHYYTENASSTNVRIGRITAYEWGCENGGDAYANVDYDDTGRLFAEGSALVSAASEGKALNVFLVSTIPYSGGGTIMGRSGGIVGSMVNGTTSSGLVFSTFDGLATSNPDCASEGVCELADQDADFIDMAGTVSHELGHFLGLNHPSESNGSEHDRVPDTPVCSTVNSYGRLSHSSCKLEAACAAVCSAYSASSGVFCPTQSPCQFNHVMWWTVKNYGVGGSGDGNIFSPYSGAIINYSPYIQ